MGDAWEEGRGGVLALWLESGHDMAATSLAELNPALRPGLDGVLVVPRTPMAKTHNYPSWAALLVPWLPLERFVHEAQAAVWKARPTALSRLDAKSSRDALCAYHPASGPTENAEIITL